MVDDMEETSLDGTLEPIDAEYIDYEDISPHAWADEYGFGKASEEEVEEQLEQDGKYDGGEGGANDQEEKKEEDEPLFNRVKNISKSQKRATTSKRGKNKRPHLQFKVEPSD